MDEKSPSWRFASGVLKLSTEQQKKSANTSLWSPHWFEKKLVWASDGCLLIQLASSYKRMAPEFPAFPVESKHYLEGFSKISIVAAKLIALVSLQHPRVLLSAADSRPVLWIPKARHTPSSWRRVGYGWIFRWTVSWTRLNVVSVKHFGQISPSWIY